MPARRRLEGLAGSGATDDCGTGGHGIVMVRGEMSGTASLRGGPRILRAAMVLCPKLDCKHVMERDPASEPGLHSALEALQCGRCGHRGLRAKDGLQVLSTAQHDYLLGYGSSSSFLRVELSSIALDLFGAHGLMPVQMATYVAEWALIMG